MIPAWARDLQARTLNMVARAIVSELTESNIQTAKLKVLAGESLEDIERVQNYGLSTMPDPDAQGVVIFVGGNRDYGLLISADHPALRKKVEQGEVALYSKFGQYIHLKKDETLEISAGKGITIKSPEPIAIETKNLTLSESAAALTVDKFSVTSASGKELIDTLVQTVDLLNRVITGLVPETGVAVAVKTQASLALPLILADLKTFKA